MQRWVTTLVGLAVVVLAVWLVAHNFRPPQAIGHDPHPVPSASASAVDAGSAAATGAPAATDAGSGPLLLSDLLDERRMDAGAGGTMLDGTPVPPLPLTVPRQVRFGVVLVSYAGAQPSAGGGSRPSTRSKPDALALAQKLLGTAEQDFHAAVQQGDGGSTDDVGHVKLGVLEPAPEYVLFTLAPGAVGGPVDTPRGYWIVKRLE
ncbi:MAG: peptidylprolyl isomerase [Polyangiaceae bacterium]